MKIKNVTDKDSDELLTVGDLNFFENHAAILSINLSESRVEQTTVVNSRGGEKARPPSTLNLKAWRSD